MQVDRQNGHSAKDPVSSTKWGTYEQLVYFSPFANKLVLLSVGFLYFLI